MTGKSASEVWRDYVIDGVPSSGVNKPSKLDIRQWGKNVESSNTVTVTDPAYGAVGDGVTNDSAAFAAALATGRTVLVPYTSTGYNLDAATLTITNGMAIIGENRVKLISTADVLFNVLGDGNAGIAPSWKFIENFTIDMSNAPGATLSPAAGSKAIYINDTTFTINYLRIQNIDFYQCVGAIVSQGNFGMDFIYVRGIRCYKPRGLQFNYVDCHLGGFLYFADVDVNMVINPTIVNFGAGQFNNFAGLIFEDLIVATGTGTGTTAYDANAIGWKFTNGLALWINGLFADTLIGDGISLNVTYLWANHIEAVNCLGSAVVMTGGTRGNIHSIIALGGVPIAHAAASKHGLSLINQSFMNIVDLLAENNTGDGLNISGNSGNNNIANYMAITNTGNAVTIAGTADLNSIINAQSSNNGGVYSLTSSGINNSFQMAGTQSGTSPVTLSGTSGNLTSNAAASVIINPSGTFTLTLPAANQHSGRMYQIKCIGGFAVISASANIVPLGSTVAGTALFPATFSPDVAKWALLQSNGTNWVVMAGN